jgi:HD-GYP domain-containing protein (c-di-GMP phosphodiesterase class II)
MPIALGTLCASSVLAFDLYLPGEQPGQMVLYRQRSYPMDRSDLERLLERGIRTLYISGADADEYREHLRDSIISNENLSPVYRYQALREAARAVLSDALARRDCGTAVAVAKDLSREMVRTVCESKLIVSELLKSMSHDYSSFTHAVNTATYCLLLAKKWGVSDENELLRIGQGALLHDIGMQHVPRHVLSKTDKLAAHERQLVRQHTTHGFLELCHRDDLTFGQMMMVYGHHERCDGLGYPVGLVRSEIHEYARLCAIADAYTALMANRPHRLASRKANVLEYLDRQAGRAFDEEMTLCWVSTVANKA